MEQKFDGPPPRAELRLDGRTVVRTDVTNDWGLQLLWVVRRDGKPVSKAQARTAATFTPPTLPPGKYEVVLQMWKYVNYAKGPDGEFTASKYVDVSNAVAYDV